MKETIVINGKSYVSVESIKEKLTHLFNGKERTLVSKEQQVPDVLQTTQKKRGRPRKVVAELNQGESKETK